MRRVMVLVAVLLLASAPASAATVRVADTVKWTVKWSIRWDGDGSRMVNLDNGKVASYFGDLDLTFSCDGGPDSCGWYVFGSFWKRSARPTPDQCRTGWETDDLGQRYRQMLYPKGRQYAGMTWTAPNGTWLCTKTDADRYGRVRILHWPTKDELWFRFSYTTWER